MAFATADDVAIRLGRDLTAAEVAFADQQIAMTTAQIVIAVGQDSDWADALSPVPEALKLICIQKVVSAGANPDGVVSESKQIGQMQRSRTFGNNSLASVYLTDQEEALAVEAVYGRAPRSTSLRSVIDRVIDLREGRDVDEEAVA